MRRFIGVMVAVLLAFLALAAWTNKIRSEERAIWQKEKQDACDLARREIGNTVYVASMIERQTWSGGFKLSDEAVTEVIELSKKALDIAREKVARSDCGFNEEDMFPSQIARIEATYKSLGHLNSWIYQRQRAMR